MKKIFSLILIFQTVLFVPLFSVYAQEEQQPVPGIREDLIEKNKDVVLLSPQYGDILPFGEKIIVQWENKNPEKEYIYYVYLYYLEGQFHMGSTYLITEETGASIKAIQEGVVAMQVYYFDEEFYYTDQREQHTYVTDILVLGIGMEIPELWYKRFWKEKEVLVPPVEEKPVVVEVPEIVPEVVVKPIVKIPPKPIVKIENEPEKFDWNFTQQTNVKGMGTRKTECRYKYISRYEKASKVACTLPELENLSSEMIEKGTYKDISVKGNIFRDTEIAIDIYACDSSFFKPLTWFDCSEKYIETKYFQIHPNIHMNIVVDGKRYNPLSFYLDRNTFHLLTQVSKTTKVNNIELEYSTYLRLSDYGIFENLQKTYTVPISIQKAEPNEPSKPFSFPFSSVVGVSQWHGFTQYQKPHTGIDFSVVKKDTLAVGDGLVVGKGWDSYFGKCLSGGNYLTIKHDNGMYTVYFHLEESFVDVGKSVKKGDLIARTGNSGFWNCQPLAYHLHFELRADRLQSSHVNPVEYIQQDWSKILTVGYKQNPGRLSGDNPHPGT